MRLGTIYGVGVGPGDPELLTLKAHRLISSAATIAYLAADASDGPRASRARRIVADIIPAGACEIEIRTPMRAARAEAQTAYDRGAAEIAERLETGQDVVVLCEGDPLLYGSFMYLLARLSSRFPAAIVPGVASPMAAAAAVQRPLVARDEPLTILPSTADIEMLETRLRLGGGAALMKLGRRLPDIKRLITRLGLLDRAYYVEAATEAGEIAVPLAEAPETAPYFSMILVVGEDPHAHAH
ncbi:MAG: precorrin-2 C(20)-methyltransferase [Neomegalonema sp.]|nr:precorrin-2 C(20)-methyltransferase [Neomegalonema sp.]